MLVVDLTIVKNHMYILEKCLLLTIIAYDDTIHDELEVDGGSDDTVVVCIFGFIHWICVVCVLWVRHRRIHRSKSNFRELWV